MDRITLDNGKVLIRDYGKYRSELILLLPNEKAEKENFKVDAGYKDLNLESDGSLTVYEGEYRISKKGNPTFEFKKNGRDWLLIVDWGGSFSFTRGELDIPEDNRKYYHRASSNGGGYGHTYYVVEAGYKRTYSEEDF